MHPKPKKSLGQNFLADKNIRKKIIAACGFGPEDIVLEIGAGRGELTGLLAEKVEKLYAVELDKDLAAGLKDNFKNQRAVKIIQQDILRLDFKRHFKDAKFKVIGNIPYYISTPIIEYLIKHRSRIKTIFLTGQKEFACRLAAAPGSKAYGSLSCYVQYYTRPKVLFTIKKGSFFPAPKVDSAFLRLDILASPSVKVKNEQLFFRIIRAAFQQRRKTLRNSLQGLISRDKLARFFAASGIRTDIRPEGLSLEDFAALAQS